MKPKSLEEIIEELDMEMFKIFTDGQLGNKIPVSEFRRNLKQALCSYALWLVEEAEPEERTSEELEKVYSGHILIDIWKKNDLYNSAIAEYKQNLKKLIEQD